MTMAISKAVEEGAKVVVCASTGNTSASAAAYAARAGLTCAVLIPEGKIALGKLAQALIHGAQVVQVRGNFDDALEIVRELGERDRVTVVNSVNPFRIEGQKTAAFEIVDALGDAPDVHCLPVGNAGNITAYWRGYTEYQAAGTIHEPPRMLGWQAAGAAPIVLRRAGAASRDDRHRHPHRQPGVVGRRDRRRDESGGAIGAVTDARSSRPTGCVAREGRVRGAGVGRVGRRAAPAARTALAARRDGRVHGHRPRAEGSRVGDRGRRRPDRGPPTPPRSPPSWGCRRALTATVPATSANLGPGFDCFGLALDLCNEVTLDTGAEPGVTWEGEGAAELPTDGTDLVSRAVAETADRFTHTAGGRDPRPTSSRSNAGWGPRPPRPSPASPSPTRCSVSVWTWTAILEVAAGLEGHPDNAAAAVFGGFTIVVDEGVVARFDPDPELRPVLFVPSDLAISTEAARRVLPDAVPRSDAVANAGHAALVAIALLHEPDLLPAAMRDRVHEDDRLGLVPEAREVFERVRGAGLAVCVSGSGPTLLAFERHDVITPEPGDGWRVVRVPVRAAGVDIREG